MICNDLKLITQVDKKKLQHEICHFVLCLHKGIGTDVKKPYSGNYLLQLANKSLFLWRPSEVSLVLLFSGMSGSGQIMETFCDKYISQCFEPH